MIRSLSRCRPCLLALCLAAAGTATVQAQSFDQALQAARSADAQYTAQLAAVQNRRLQARQAGAAYYPSAAFNYNQADLTANGNSTRSLSLSQPLLSYDRYLTLKQASPLDALAYTDSVQAGNDLALRVFSAMADIVRNREQIRALGVQVDSLQEQLKRALRMRELGQGTITEVSDFEVRLAVAQANRVNLRNALQAAERNFSLVTGLRADTAALQVEVPPWQDPRSPDQLVADVRENAVAAQSAQRSLELAEIAAKRVTGQYLPQLTAQLARVQTSGSEATNSSRVALTLSVPLGASPYYDYQRAATDVLRAQESLRFARDSAGSEATRLLVAVQSYSDEVAIRQRALEAARLAVDANVRSYQGGVKTNIDVVTSYQNLADAEAALVTSRLSQREAWLRLALLAQMASAPQARP